MIAVDNDLFRFAAETPVDNAAASSSQQTWKIMLVDDEPAVHQATKVALKFFTFKGRSLSFISAYSATEAKQLIANHSDTVLILLDVIMNTQDAGLKVAKYIREELRNTTVRIVLRTGQPGRIPEESVVVDYDINDYKTKLELTQEKLFTTIVSSIRAYCDLVALSKSQAALARANSELATLNRNLEQRVQARTQALTHEVKEREKAEESLRLYIHALTHDLRNPVTGMSTLLQTMLNRAAANNLAQIQIPTAVLSRMQAGCDRQLKMISTLIETQAVKVWGVSLACQCFDIGVMLHEIVEDWQPQIDKKRVSVVIQLAPDLPLVEGDRTQLWRVFENLIDNALKYNPPGITLTLAINLHSPDLELTGPGGPVIHCTVQDNGVGISAEQTNSLFELYQRGASSSPSQGLGLGLYICKCIVTAHGGTIGVNSPSGSLLDSPPDDQNSTEFWFTLPVQQPTTQPTDT
jgi:signal transduction histidine kinase